ncbi:small ribosomal subunit protein eS27-like [Mobula birostris]|uniref:small ribosomal subunit protein eS27-like n=1 Tax=Mobula birostris TaxID=1983395 RepID=UPI003B27F901
MVVKCPGCYKITTVFSHAQTVVLCVGCPTLLCQPTGGTARLTEGCSFWRKQHRSENCRLRRRMGRLGHFQSWVLGSRATLLYFLCTRASAWECRC